MKTTTSKEVSGAVKIGTDGKAHLTATQVEELATRRFSKYANTPHKTIEDICTLAKDRLASGEQAHTVYSDLVEGFGFDHQSANSEMIRDAARVAQWHKPALAAVKPVCSDLSEPEPDAPGEREAVNIVFAMPEIIKLGSTYKMELAVREKIKPLIELNAELLAALEMIDRACRSWVGQTEIQGIARAAIESAKGGGL